jgi:myo-inositol 2-dehydrogenase / D-chiro-inositol 1-dehydrogenase
MAIEVGIIGCGGMGKIHARHLAALPGARLRAYADPRAGAAMALLDEHGGGYVAEDANRLLADDGLDAVFICTHHHLHHPLCIQAAHAGKHVLVEKPLALTVRECEEIEAAVEAAGVKLVVGFMARFSPFVERLKAAVPRPLVSVGQLIDPRWPDISWANDPVEGGGNVLSQGCHCFDLLAWLHESEPVTVYAGGGNLHHPALPITDAVAATLHFASGAVSSAVVGDVGRPAVAGKSFYELFGGDRTATLAGFYDDPILRCWNAEPASMTMADLPEAERSYDHAHGYPQMVRAFIEWAAGGDRPPQAALAHDGARATRIAAAAIESARSGQPQSLRPQ